MDLNEDFLLLLDASALGEGEPDLGERLMKAFLSVLLESDELPARIICMNSGIFLTTEGSPVLDVLKQYEKKGAEILSCGTCLDYYGRSDKLEVGRPTNMKETVDALLRFKKIVKP